MISTPPPFFYPPKPLEGGGAYHETDGIYMILFVDFFNSKRKNHLHMVELNHANTMENMFILVFLRVMILGCGRQKYKQESFLKKSVNSFFLTCLFVRRGGFWWEDPNFV